jgi:hypothetical protein
MVSAEFFDLLEEQVAKIRFKRNDYKYVPFGGVQLIVCGVHNFEPSAWQKQKIKEGRRGSHAGSSKSLGCVARSTYFFFFVTFLLHSSFSLIPT